MIEILVAPAPPVPPAGFRERRRERRRLAELDRRSAALAELHRMAALLRASASLVERGWVQGDLFAYSSSGSSEEVVGACLVGAVVTSGGGVAQARTQLVQRSLDLTWHTLRRSSAEPVRWCPGPTFRALQVRDLARWNDAPGRRASEVSGLLVSAADSADARRLRQHAAAAGDR